MRYDYKKENRNAKGVLIERTKASEILRKKFKKM